MLSDFMSMKTKNGVEAPSLICQWRVGKEEQQHFKDFSSHYMHYSRKLSVLPIGMEVP